MKKPNILLIMADQLAPQALSFYGNPVCKTPNLDKLASKSIIFENAYSNNPICVPSRASMLTGQLTPEIAVYDNANDIGSSIPTMAHYLRSLGYWTFLSGKMHFIGPDQLHGFNERLTTDVYPATYDWISNWSAGPSYVPSGTALNGIVEAGPCIRTMQEDYDDEVEFQSLKKIYDLARNNEQNPFFGIVSFTSPHTPFNVAQKYWDLYKSEDINMPEVGPIPFDELDYFSKALFFAHGRHRHTITNDHIRNTRQAYYGMISYIDEKIGKILNLLEETNQRENTAVFFVSDHGEMLGERGMWFKQCFWEWSAHVPMIASIPDFNLNKRIKKVTSLIDLLPTFIDIGSADKQMPNTEYLSGSSLMSEISASQSNTEGCAISDYFHIGPCVPTRMVRKGNYKLIYTHGHPHLLFDLEKDPSELINLANQDKYQHTLNSLLEICKKNWDPEKLTEQIIKSQKDRLMIKSLPGDPPDWDFIAQMGDEKRFVRRDGVDFTKGKLRIPKVKTIQPDLPDLDQDTIMKIISGEIEHNFN